MMQPAKAERLTAFHTGGISPFGQKKHVPTAFEEKAITDDLVVMNGGKRGLMIRLNAAQAVQAARAIRASLCAD